MPHGGVLVNRLLNRRDREEWLRKLDKLPKLIATPVDLANIEMISIGGYSPLTGFMDAKTYQSVIRTMRLPNGLVWTIPILLPIPEELAMEVKSSDAIVVFGKSHFDKEPKPYAIVSICDVFRRNKEDEAKFVYGTTDASHPGVERIYNEPEWAVGGEVFALEIPIHPPEIQVCYMKPASTRSLFRARGCRKVVGFQTRNPLHRAHEYLVKCALETVDGLFIHPLVGPTKSDDIPAEIRMKCYRVLVEKYFPKERVVLAVNPAPMWYAGPREAIFHAIVRKNYGCTHFIVGRDHAGVGKFYHPFAAHKIFDQFLPEELGITPIFFDDAFYCTKCESMATCKVCPHEPECRIYFSGTKVRSQLKNGEIPPPYITRPEVAIILANFYRNEGAAKAAVKRSGVECDAVRDMKNQ
ncbi:MAG: sulfate adenylyltransferase [Armatimonadota bacterium]|nr:sulfate adenylyltransferase [Armatimonadota bacterium]MDW8026550.1 sulfate adenylyltransferase [Armatimonadota bacterium]